MGYVSFVEGTHVELAKSERFSTMPLRRWDPTACEIAVGIRSRMESDPVVQCDLITIFPWWKAADQQGVHDDWQKMVLWHQIFLFPMRFLHGIKIPKVIMPRLSCWGLLSRRLGGSLFRKQRGCPSKLSRLSIRRFRITFQPFMFERRPTIRHPVDLSDR